MLESFWRGSGLVSLLAGALATFSSGCLDRPLCVDCNPQTTNQFVVQVPTGGIDKIDLLFMIDNSASMSDKQALLKRAVPSLVSRFVNPLCVDAQGRPNGQHLEAGKCATGAPEFPAVQDIHIAVISSSLGVPASTNQCDPAKYPQTNDYGSLLPKARPGLGLEDWNGSGFLAWDPLGTKNTPAGTRDDQQLATSFQNMVTAVGEKGCGYEASLESWYRFLIQPDPEQSMKLEDHVSVPVGLDTELLAQRKAFLRPDSLVAVVMLSDENDCSLRRQGQGFLAAAAAGSMPRANAACASNPNDRCCRPCVIEEAAPPQGCAPLAQDVECKKGKYLSPAEDSPSLRCWDQKRRFGLDLLEPTSKYIAALTQPVVYDRANMPQPNPLFAPANGKPPRAPNLVYLAGIVGVPWQDIASDESLSGPGLRYLTAAELREKNRWDLILGDPATNQPPSDPHMIESSAARSGSHPFVAKGSIAPADAAVAPTTDVISGHEQANPEDLQYACIYELENPTACTGCDCDGPGAANNKRPLCQAPNGGAFGATQYFAKAYPGRRHLEVLKGIGEQAIVASICPKVTRSADPDNDANFGYNPAIAALVDRFVGTLKGKCLGRAPAADAEGRSSCVVLEVELDGACNCQAEGREDAPGEVLASIREDMKRDGTCDGSGRPACSSVCACSLEEAEGSALADCRSTKDPGSQRSSYCYVDPDKGLGDPALVMECPATGRRLLRFVGADTPVQGSVAYMACMGSVVP